MGKVDFGGVCKRVCLEHVPEVAVGRLRPGPRRLRPRRGSTRHEARRVFEFLERDEGSSTSCKRRSRHEIPRRIPRRRGRRSSSADGDRAAVTTGRGRSWKSAAGRRTPSSSTASTELLPPAIELVHGPGCPVCVTPLEMIDRAHRHRLAAGRASSARSATCSACPARRGDLLAAQGAGRRRPRRLLAARRREPGGSAPGPQGRLLRRRLRDDGAGQRDGRLAGASGAADELQRAGLARPGAAGDDRDPGRAGQPRAGLPRPPATSAP